MAAVQKPPGPQSLGAGRYQGLRDAAGPPGPAQQLGEGAYGTVFLYQDTQHNNELVAIKQIKLQGLEPWKAQSHDGLLPRELRNYYAMNFPFIIKFRNLLLEGDSLWIVMDYARGDTLYKRVCHGANEETARWYFRQVIVALRYLHAKDIAHRDIKLENTLLQPVEGHLPEVRLADMGFSKHTPPNGPWAATNCGTEDYKAPEVLKTAAGQLYNPPTADVWAAGVMLYSMLHTCYPFPLLNKEIAGNTPLPLKLQQQRAGPRLSTRLSAGCRDLLLRMLTYNPDQRITIEGVLAHPWVLEGLPAGLLEMQEQALALGDQPTCEKSPEELEQLIGEVRAKLAPQILAPAGLAAVA